MLDKIFPHEKGGMSMKVKTIEDLKVPDHLVGRKSFESEDAVLQWEDELIQFFTSNRELFTQYPEYFKLRCYEFRILRQLLPEYLSINANYQRGLEIGCG
jgi:hypothetical protein